MTLVENRDFMLLWGAQSVSQTGSQVTVLALPLVAIVTLNASTLQVGLLSVATTCAYLFAPLPAGLIVDRASKRATMLWCNALAFAGIASVPIAYEAGVLGLGQLYVCALAVGVCSACFLIAQSSYLPALVRPDELVEANSRFGTTVAGAQFAGPGLGAVLVGTIGAALAMAADAFSYAVAAVLLVAIRTREPEAEPRADPRGTPLRRRLTAGLSYVAADPILRKSVAWNGTANFFVIIVETLGPVMLVRLARVPPALVGVLLAAGSVGGIAAGVLYRSLAARVGSARLTWLSVTVLTLLGLSIPLAGRGWSMLLFAIGWVSWSFGSTLCGVGLVSYQQRTCPTHLRGQVAAAVRWINWGTLPVGGLAAGFLGATLGVRAALWIAACGGCAAGLWLLASPLRSARHLPIPVEAAW